MPTSIIEDENSILKSVDIEGVSKSYILKNPALEKILFNRNIIGLPFTSACESSTRAFFKHFESEFNFVSNSIAELMILTKGMYYWIHNAYASTFNRNLEINYVSTNRVEVTSDEKVRVEVWTSNLDAPAENLVLGDTIASGATICAALSQYTKHHPLKRVFIFSIVGSRVGGKTVAHFCRQNNIDLTLVYGLAAFGLAPNGFDLSFLHPDTIADKEYIEKARKSFMGKPVSSAGWDFGTQAQAIRKYKMLCWIESKLWGLDNSGVFLETEPPIDLRLVEKERAAYKDVFPDLRAILPMDSE